MDEVRQNSPSCQICGKAINENDEFILVGRYPESAIEWIGNRHSGHPVRHFKAPETYGLLHHKSCFLESVRKENAGEAI